jgi:hypothetical protein
LKTHCVIVACALLLAPAPACAGMIVGIGNSGLPFTGTTFFAVDPITGSTTPFGQFPSSQYYAASSSPVDGTFFALSPVNLYRINPFTGEFVGYLCASSEDCTYVGNDHAYDPSNQNTYALRNVGNDELLVQMVDRGLLLPVGSAPLARTGFLMNRLAFWVQPTLASSSTFQDWVCMARTALAPDT